MYIILIFIGLFSLESFANEHDNTRAYINSAKQEILKDRQKKVNEHCQGNTDSEACEEAKKALSTVENDILGRTDKCESAEADWTKTKKELREACSDFSHEGGCDQTIKTCQECPDNTDHGNVKCRQFHQNHKAKCPQLSGEELKNAKKDRENAEEKIKTLEESITQLKADLLEEQNELSGARIEFEQGKTDIETQLVAEREDLDGTLERDKKNIDQKVEAKIATLNERIATALKARHAIENSISDAHRQLRIDKNKVYFQCRSYAGQELANYRQKRRQAIAAGTFKQSSIRDLMRKNRISLAQKDNARFKHYYNICLRNSRTQIKEIEAGHKETLKRVKQKKLEYLETTKRLQNDVSNETKNAVVKKNKAINTYYKKIHRTLKKFRRKEQNALQTYQSKQAHHSKKINVFNQDLEKKMGSLDQTKKIHADNRELQTYLEKGGAKEDNHFGKAIAAAETQDEAFHQYLSDCGCFESDNWDKTTKLNNKYAKCNNHVSYNPNATNDEIFELNKNYLTNKGNEDLTGGGAHFRETGNN